MMVQSQVNWGISLANEDKGSTFFSKSLLRLLSLINTVAVLSVDIIDKSVVDVLVEGGTVIIVTFDDDGDDEKNVGSILSISSGKFVKFLLPYKQKMNIR